MLGPKIIKTPRLWLRLLSPGSARAYHKAAMALVNDAQDQANMLTFPHPFTPRHARLRMDLAQQWWRANIGLSYGVWLGPRLIGQVQIVTHGARQRQAEIAYWISAPERGQGYAAEAVESLIHVAHAHWPLEKIEATVVPSNHASARLLSRLGFDQEAQENVPYDLPHQWPLGLHRLHTRRGVAPLLIFARSLSHGGDEHKIDPE